MDVEFTVSLIELKRAFRRLSVRLPDESEAGGELVVFNARHSSLEIVARGTTEGLSVAVIRSGRASIPFPVFRGIVRALRYYRGTSVRFVFSAEVLRINRTCFRHPSISVLTPLASVSQDR
jgi:hypothetical protein